MESLRVEPEITEPTGKESEEDVEVDDEYENLGLQDEGLDDEEGDPVAEGEEAPPPEPEPSYQNANDLPFFPMCRRLEKLWMCKKHPKKKQPPVAEKLKAILPPKGLKVLSEPRQDGKHQSLFPLMRLLIPEKDASRHIAMKENVIANAYADAFRLPPGEKQKLKEYRNPQIVMNMNIVGDFTCVVEDVLKGRITSQKSDFTVGEINSLLDDLAQLPQRASAAKARNISTKKKVTLSSLRAEWIQRLNPKHRANGLSALEHKWLIRIIMQQMQYGFGWRRMLEWYNPNATALYDAHTSLRAICNILCLPEFTNADNDTHEDAPKEGLSSYLPTSKIPLQFGKPFQPMSSIRTSFGRCLNDISARHRNFAEREGSSATKTLAFQHPAFCAETKLDGERMIVHVRRDGQVRIHSRTSVWHSSKYSPVLGPAVRRATAAWNVDVILDGEVLSWDSGREETIAFGNNRTVAKLRYEYLKKKGILEEIDLGIGKEDGEEKSYRGHQANTSTSDENVLAGEECWLQLVAFDVLYVDGPDASRLLKETLSPRLAETARPGPLIDLDAFERKKLLYRLVEEVKHQVEVVPTWVIRPTGRTVLGKDYFSYENPAIEYGQPTNLLDSMSWTLQQEDEYIQRLDTERRQNMSNEDVSQARAWAISELYTIMVDNQRMEGLMFKDLSTPYYLGQESKSLAYWHKFKPDYYNGSAASDLDVVIIGAYFASGLRHAVNAGGMTFPVLDEFFKSTGFVYDSETGTYDQGDRWFVRDDRSIPDFISLRTMQSENEMSWKPMKKDYPDLWITPNESRILTLNAGEIVASDVFSAGLTLRFPRVTALRNTTDKSVSDIESEYNLWGIYEDTLENRLDNATDNKALNLGSPVLKAKSGKCRFLTESQFNKETKAKRKKPTIRKKLFHVNMVDYIGERASNVLEGLVFTVLEGSYVLHEDDVDMDEARELGWLDFAKTIKSSSDLKRLIQKHGGKVHITPSKNSLVVGGRSDDPKVLSYIQAIENSQLRLLSRKSKIQTQQALVDQEMSERPGILHWPFVLTLIYSGLSRVTGSDMRKPTILDYLARPSKPGATDTVSDLVLEDINSAGFLKRALDVISKTSVVKQDTDDERPWQRLAIDEFEPCERWVFKTQLQSLWPYDKGDNNDAGRIVTLYPAVADTNERNRPDCIRAVLPLARVMGAVVSWHLTSDVTHVLCDLEEGVDQVPVDDVSTTETVFKQHQQGRRLLGQLERLGKNDVTLVSPTWLRKRKWNQDRADCG